MKYWGKEQLKRINDDPALVSLLYDLDLLPEQVMANERQAVEMERERCAKISEEFITDSDQTKTFRNAMAKNIATAIRQSEPSLRTTEPGRESPATKNRDYDPSWCRAKDPDGTGRQCVLDADHQGINHHFA